MIPSLLVGSKSRRVLETIRATSGNGQRTNWNDEERESKREKKANKNDKSFLPSFTFLR
jgi:hypothetical protein